MELQKLSKMSKEEKQKLTYVIIAVVLIVALLASVIATIVVVSLFPGFKEISYSEFNEKLTNGTIVAARFSNNEAYLLYEKDKRKYERFKDGRFQSARVTFKDATEKKEAMQKAKLYLEGARGVIENPKLIFGNF